MLSKVVVVVVVVMWWRMLLYDVIRCVCLPVALMRSQEEVGHTHTHARTQYCIDESHVCMFYTATLYMVLITTSGVQGVACPVVSIGSGFKNGRSCLIMNLPRKLEWKNRQELI